MKRRYSTAQEIIDDIDKCYVRSRAYYAMAEDWDKQADELFNQPEHLEQAKELRAAAKAKRTRAYNLVNVKMKELGDKLSEFCTATMPILPDNSIPAGTAKNEYHTIRVHTGE